MSFCALVLAAAVDICGAFPLLCTPYAKKLGYKEGINRLVFKAPKDRYAGQLKELARILRGEIPNPPGLYLHDLKVHKVSLDACNLETKKVW